MVNVELVYIPLDQNPIQMRLTLAEGATIADVLHESGLLLRNPEIKDLSVGIFGRLVSLNKVVKSGDRVEIYRPLLIDPKEKRRQRAQQK